MVDTDLVKTLAELVDGPPWQIADLLLERFPVDEYGEAAVGVNSDLYAALDECEDELRRDFGVVLHVTTMRIARATAIAWPADTRVSAAPYSVHRSLRARRDRAAVLTRLVKRHKGHLTYQQYRGWHQTQHPKVGEPWEARIERRIRSLAKEAGTAKARHVMADLFDQIAVELRA